MKSVARGKLSRNVKTTRALQKGITGSGKPSEFVDGTGAKNEARSAAQYNWSMMPAAADPVERDRVVREKLEKKKSNALKKNAKNGR